MGAGVLCSLPFDGAHARPASSRVFALRIQAPIQTPKKDGEGATVHLASWKAKIHARTLTVPHAEDDACC